MICCTPKYGKDELKRLLGNRVKESSSFGDLVKVVSDHLSGIHHALKEFEKHQIQSPDANVVEQMRKLNAKIKKVESESARTKALLENERRNASRDALTGLPNRSAYAERSFHELRRFKRYHRNLVLAVCDVDHFKKVNDAYGRQAGDKALKFIAKVLRNKIRKVDFIARHGGEEFVILMPETTSEQAYKVLEKVRRSVAGIPFKMNASPLRVTISIGLTQFVTDDTMNSVFERADKALYRAKTTGRNKCEIELKRLAKDVVKSAFSNKSKPVTRSKEISFK